MSPQHHTSVVGDSCAWVDSGELFVLGVLMSSMHMAWVRQVCGRIESRYRYSNEIVYNNFPWPSAASDARKDAVGAAAQEMLDARAFYKGESLADLYDPLGMPPELVSAHKKLDRAVERCYRVKPFKTDLERLDYLFDLYVSLGTQPELHFSDSESTRKRQRPSTNARKK